MFYAQYHAQYVRIEGGGIRLRRLVGDGAALALSSRVVDGDIQSAKSLYDLVNEVAHFIFVANVGADELCFDPAVTEF